MPRRVDRNQREIVQTLRELGMSVLCLHAVGKGCPDLLVGFRGKNYLIEVKDGEKPESQRKLTPAEAVFLSKWLGHYMILKSVSETLQFAKDIGASSTLKSVA